MEEDRIISFGDRICVERFSHDFQGLSVDASDDTNYSLRDCFAISIRYLIGHV